MGNLYSRGIARESLMGYERTTNPNPAATSLIGKGRVRAARSVFRRVQGPRRSAFRGNPVPALLLTLAPSLSKVFGSGPDEKKQAIRVERLNDYSYQVINTKGAIGAKALADLKAVAQRMEGHGVAINDVTVNHARELLQAIGAAATPPSGAPKKSALDTLLGGGVAGIPGAGLGGLAGLGGALPQGVKYNNKGQLVQRVFQGNNQFTGKPIYKNVVVRGAAGAIGTAALPGAATAVGGIGVAGVAGAAAAGAAAYLMTSLLLKHLGGKSVSAQKAGVQAAIDHRTVLQQYPKDKVAINKAYFDTLAQLGYNPTTFARDRSFIEKLTEDYNPFD